MQADEFINAIKMYVRDAALNDTIASLQSPPGRKPAEYLKQLSKRYKAFSTEEKESIHSMMEYAIHSAIFGFLCVIDGARVIENTEEKGDFTLMYTQAGQSLAEGFVLNKNFDLHDLFNQPD